MGEGDCPESMFARKDEKVGYCLGTECFGGRDARVRFSSAAFCLMLAIRSLRVSRSGFALLGAHDGFGDAVELLAQHGQQCGSRAGKERDQYWGFHGSP